MSKNVNSNEKKSIKEFKRNGKIYINHIIDSSLESESSMTLRKRAERQASQGVKALVEREKGNSSDRMSVDSQSVQIDKSASANQNIGVQSQNNTKTFPNQILKQESVNRGVSTNIQGNTLSYSTNNPNISSNVAGTNSSSSYFSTQYQSHSHMNTSIGMSYQTKNTQLNQNSYPNQNLFSTTIPQPSHNVPQYIVNNPHGQNLQTNMLPSSSSRQIFNRPQKEEKEKIINRVIFEKILIDKVKREGLEIKNFNEILSIVNIGMEMYLKNMIEKLISISRARNVNLNLYSKSSEKNPTFKIHSYNVERQITSNNQIEFSPAPFKDFSIIFTKNTKNCINMLEEYEELSLKKMRQEKMVLYKNKLEEITTQKEKEKTVQEKPEKFTQSLIVRPRGRKRESSMLKSVRNTLAKSQKKIEMDRQKKDTQNTLETFLDNKPKFRETSSQLRFDTEMGSNIAESHNYETYTKLSEISKSEAPGTLNITTEAGSNEINICVFKSPVPSQNTKIPHSVSVRRRITLKDLIFYLERERNVPLYNLVLYKAMIKLGQFSSH